MSEDGYLTSSGKPKCTTTHYTQLKARIVGGAVKERANRARST